MSETGPRLVIVSAMAANRVIGRTVWSAGGGGIYRQTVPLADEMALSFIKGEFEGDTFFHEFDESDWDVIEREDHPAYEYVRYRRR